MSTRLGWAPPSSFEPNLACGHCTQCLDGRYNICRELLVRGCQTPGELTGTSLQNGTVELSALKTGDIAYEGIPGQSQA